MLIYDFHIVGNKLLAFRKKIGMTQAEVAEKAGLSDRTYADIERGTVNMRVETVLRICEVLRITPDEIFVDDKPAMYLEREKLMERLDSCTNKEREAAIKLLGIFLDSLN